MNFTCWDIYMALIIGIAIGYRLEMVIGLLKKEDK